MIKYPGGKKAYKKTKNLGLTGSRGMSLEEDINKSNEHYRYNDLAIVHKKPTPIQIVNVDYPSRNKAKITEAYFTQASTTDYQGVYNGYSLDFEAKETKNKTLFPLASLHDHQINHLRAVHKHGAVAFIIVRFNTLDEMYLIFAKDLLNHIETKEKRSLAIEWIRDVGYEIESTFRIPCDYLKVLKNVSKEEIL